MGRLAVGTIIAKNRLSLARVLVDSFHKFHPEIPAFVLLADEIDGYFAPEDENFHLLRLEEIGIPNLPRFRFQHSQLELSFACTPFLIGHLLDRGYSSVGFFKQESLVIGDLSPVLDELGGSAISLVPHLLGPLKGASGIVREMNILQSGVFNVGFLGVSECPSARRFLAWWQDRIWGDCRHNVSGGMHYEQRWLDLVPTLFEDVRVLRDPGFNVGHWNLPERKVKIAGDDIQVDSEPGRFIRFSGFDPDQPSAVTKYDTRLSIANVGPAAVLFERYRNLLMAADYQRTKTWPYAFDSFDNGVPVPRFVRHLYFGLGDAAERFGDPRASQDPDGFFRWLNQPASGDAAPSRPITALWKSVYDQRFDLQKAFPDIFGRDREAFLTWAASQGVVEHGIHECFVVS